MHQGQHLRIGMKAEGIARLDGADRLRCLDPQPFLPQRLGTGRFDHLDGQEAQFGGGQSGQEFSHERQYIARAQSFVPARLVCEPEEQGGKELGLRQPPGLGGLARQYERKQDAVGIDQGRGDGGQRPARQLTLAPGQNGGQLFGNEAIVEVLELIAKHRLADIAEDAGVVEVEHRHRGNRLWPGDERCQGGGDLCQVFREPVARLAGGSGGLRLGCRC